MELLKKMSVFTVANFLNKGIVFLLIPVLTTYLSPEEQGTLSLFTTTLALISPLVLLQVVGAVNVEYFRKDFGEESFPNYVSSALMISGGMFLMVCVLLGFFSKEFLDFTGLSASYLFVIPCCALFASWIEMLKTNYIIRGEASQFGLFLVVLTLLDILVSLILITSYSYGAEGRILGIMISKLVFGLIALLVLRKKKLLSSGVEKKLASDIARFGVPLLPHAIGGILLHSSDQYFINDMLGRDILGIYSVAYTIGSTIMLIDISFNQAFTPYMMGMLKDVTEEKKIKIVRISYVYIGVLFVCLAGLYLVLPYIYEYFVNVRYHAGIKYVMLIALGYVFLGIYKTFTNYLFFMKKAKVIGAIAFLCAAVNILLNYFWINKYGAIGAAMATATSFFLFLVLTGCVAHHHYPMPWLKALNFKDD